MHPACRIAALAAVLATPFGAKAATVTDHFSVSLDPSAFTIFSGPMLSGPVTLSFDLTFDPTLSATETFSGFSNLSYNFGLGSAVGYEVTPSSAASLPGTLVVGGAADGVDTVQFGTADFYLHVTDVASHPTFQQFGLTTANGYYYTPTDPKTSASTATGVTFSYSPVAVSAVPLPATMPMFGAALLGLAGFRLFRRRRAPQA